MPITELGEDATNPLHVLLNVKRASWATAVSMIYLYNSISMYIYYLFIYIQGVYKRGCKRANFNLPPTCSTASSTLKYGRAHDRPSNKF